MPSRSEVKFTSSLRLKKVREAEHLFLVEGEKGVLEAISSGWNIKVIYSISDVSIGGRQADLVSVSDMEKMSALSSASPFLAIVEMKDWEIEFSQIRGHWLLLDGIADPGNLGTIIRTANWFGIQGIFCTETCVELFNPKVVQATMGSIFHQPVINGDSNDFISAVKALKHRLIGASIQGKNVNDFDFKSNDILVIGNESRGISNEIEGLLDHLVKIPGKGKAESLNASVAAGILMSKF